MPFSSDRVLSFEDWKRLCPALEPFLSAAQSGGIPKALLFHGAPGVGKHLLARLVAMRLMCKAEAKPCMTCPACQRVIRNQHTNLLIPPSDAGKSIKISDLRKLLDDLSRHPLEAGKRVVLIPDADLMTIQSQNALLKSIEEPDENTWFLLTTDNERGVLATIRSRCAKVFVPRWPLASVDQMLQQEGVDEKARAAVLPLCGGSPETALLSAGDEGFFKILALAKDSIFSVSALSDLPAASMLLKNARDSALPLLNMVERHAESVLQSGTDAFAPSDWSRLSPASLKRILNTVFLLRQYKAANVSWQSMADLLLFSIAEEFNQCRQS